MNKIINETEGMLQEYARWIHTINARTDTTDEQKSAEVLEILTKWLPKGIASEIKLIEKQNKQ